MQYSEVAASSPISSKTRSSPTEDTLIKETLKRKGKETEWRSLSSRMRYHVFPQKINHCLEKALPQSSGSSPKDGENLLLRKQET
jgi:hypothetical protein